jgi:hypothetical protein
MNSAYIPTHFCPSFIYSPANICRCPVLEELPTHPLRWTASSLSKFAYLHFSIFKFEAVHQLIHSFIEVIT